MMRSFWRWLRRLWFNGIYGLPLGLVRAAIVVLAVAIIPLVVVLASLVDALQAYFLKLFLVEFKDDLATSVMLFGVGPGAAAAFVLGVAVIYRQRRRKARTVVHRFSDIADMNIRTTFVKNEARILNHRNGAGLAGVGPTILAKIFEETAPGVKMPGHVPKLFRVSPKRESTWETLRQNMKRAEICMTPVFSTSARRKDYLFSSPLYYSEVGLYVDPKSLESANVTTGMTLEEARKRLSHHVTRKGVKVGYVKGEISEDLARQMFPAATFREVRQDEDVHGSIERFMGSRDIDLIFMETFHANRLGWDSSNIGTNILAPHELLFPVCIMLKKDEDLLLNFINLRLMELGPQLGSTDELWTAITDSSDAAYGKEEVRISGSFIRHRAKQGEAAAE